MASSGEESKPQLMFQNSQESQQMQEKSAGVPLSDFVLQLEDYAPTVSNFCH